MSSTFYYMLAIRFIFDSMNWVTLQIVTKVLIRHVFAAPGFESTIELSEDNTNAAHCRSLPSKEFDALWDCLIYDNDLKEEIFRYMQTALIVSSCQVDASLIGLNRLILLSGPPGKFTLKIQSFKVKLYGFKVKLCGCYILHKYRISANSFPPFNSFRGN